MPFQSLAATGEIAPRSPVDTSTNPSPGTRRLLTLLLFAAYAWAFSIATLAQTKDTISLALTTEEQEWLQRHAASASLFFNTSFPPIEFSSPDSQFIGMGADVIALVERRLGVTFPKRPCEDWNYHLSALASGECAIAPTIVRTVEREDYTLFTTPYATVPVVIITAQSTRGYASLDDLAGQRVAVVSGFATEKYLNDQARGRFEVVPVRDVSEGLRSLAFGHAYAFVENLAVAAYYIQVDGIPSLKVAGTTDYSFAWSIGISREYPQLYGAIQKALDAIPASELEAVRKRWISLEVQQGLDPELMRWLGLGALFVAALILSLTGITVILRRRLNEKVADLRESEKRFRELFNLAPVPMLIVTKNGAFVDMNESFVRLTGYALEDTPDLDHWWPRAYPDPVYRQHVIDTWGAAVSNAFKQHRAVESAEYAVTCKDGTVRSLLIGASFHGSNLIVILYDISDRKQSEEALRESEVRFRATFEQMAVGIAHVAPDGRWLRVNQKLCDIVGYTAEELASKTFQDITHPEDLDKDLEQVTKMLSGEIRTYSMEKRYFRKDSSIVWVNLTAALVRESEGTPRYFISVVEDITERKQAEEALLRISAAVESSSDAIGMSTADGHHFYQNEAFTRLFGYELDETVTLHPQVIYADPEKAKTVFQVIMAGGSFQEEVAMIAKDGRRIHIMLRADSITDRDGRVIGLIGIHTDITERKRAEEALRESEDRYRNFVSNATEGIYRIDFVPPVPLDLPERELIERLAQSAIVGEVNEHLARMYGLSPSAMIGRHATDFAPGYGERALLAIRAPHFQVSNQETQDVDCSGHAVFLMESFTGVVEDGYLTNIWGVQRDITERKRAEEKLRSSEERFRKAFETSPDAVTISKLSNGEFVSTNQGFSRISGYSAEETIGKTSEEIGIWKNIEDRARLIEALRRSGTVRDFETQFRVKKGYIDGSLSASVVELDGEPHLLAIIRDITDRKRADELLRESENLLRQSQRVAHLGHYVFDAISGTWTSSEGLDEIFGIGSDYPRDVEGWARLMHPEQREEMAAYLKAHVLQNHNLFDKEYRIVRANDQEVRWVHGLGKLDIRDGIAVRMFGTIQDITERKHAEEELLLKDRALSSSVNAVMINDLDGRTLYVNDSFLKIFGYSKQDAYRLMATDLAYYPEENDLVCGSIRSQGFFMGETTAKHRDGSAFPVQCTASAITDAEGKPIAVMGSFVDITKRVEAETALRERHKELNCLYRVSSLTESPDTSMDEVLRQTVSLIPPALRNPEITEARIVMEGRVFQTEGFKETPWTTHHEIVVNGTQAGRVEVCCLAERQTIDEGPFLIEERYLLNAIAERLGLVAERRQAEEAFRRQRDLVDRIVATSPVGIVATNRDGEIAFTNEFAESIIGRQKDEIIRRRYDAPEWPIFDLDGHPLMDDQSPFAQVRSSGQSVNDVRLALLRRDGTRVLLSINASPLFDTKGEFDGVIAAIQDITERVRAEQTLRESEDRASRAFLASPALMAISTVAEGRLVEVNEVFLSALGYCREEVIGKTVSELGIWVDMRDREAVVCSLKEQGHIRDFLTRIRAHDGHILHGSFSAEIIELHGVPHLLTMMNDITERLKAEEALRLRESYLSAIIENQPGLLWLKDTDSRFLSVNRQFAISCGKDKPEDVVGLSDSDVWPHELAEKYRADDAEVMKSKRPITVEELISEGGVGIWFETFKTPVLDETGEVIGTTGFAHDITARKNAEEALRRSEERYRNFIAHTHEGIFRIDMVPPLKIDQPYDELVREATATAMVGEINEAQAKIYGYRPEQMTGRPVRDFVPNCGTQIAELSRQPDFRIAEHEATELTQSGQEVHLLESYFGIVADGMLTRIWGVQLNITERKKAEEALRESEEKYRRIVDTANEGVWVLDTNSVTVFVNARWAEMLGYSQDEIVGRRFHDFISDEDKTDHDRKMENRARGIKEQYEMRFRRKDGSVLWTLVSAAPIIDGKGRFTGSFGMIADITERKLAEDRLRESERKLREAQEMAHLGHWFFDVKTGAVEWSDEIYKIFGLDPREFTPHIEAILDLSPWLEDHERDKEIIRRSIETHQPSSYEQRFLRPDKSIGYYYSTFHGNFDENGELVSIVGTVLDITERKRAEEALRQNAKRVEALLKLNQMTDATLKEVTDYALEEAVSITESKLGYLAFLNEDETVLTMHSWSSQAMKECAIIDKPIRYVVSETGLWGEAVRQRRAVITNDYAAPSPWKKGYPDGHVDVKRHMNVPIFVGNHIVAVVGVGNKESDYDENDAKQLTLLMEGMYRLVERLDAENAIADSERKFRTLFENMREGVALQEVIYDDQGTAVNYRILDVNSAYEQHTGISPDHARGKLATELYGTDTPPYLDRWGPVAETGVPDAFETYFEPMQRHFRISAVSPARGTFATVFLDITEQKTQEAAIREREEKLRSIFRVAPIGIGLVRDRIIMDVNEHLCQMTGYTREELLGQSARMLYPTQEDFEYVGREKYRQISEHGTGTVETHWQHKDGSIRNIVLSSSPLDIADLHKGVTFTALDITDRKRAEEAVREKAEELDRYFTSALDLLCIADTDGNFRRLNKEWEAVLGYPLEELAGQRFLDLIHPDDLQSTLAAISELAEQREVVSFANRYRCKDGSYRWIEWRSFPQGNLIYACARDVTDRKRAEEEIRQLNEDLEQRVVERTAQLQAANKELEAFSYSVSHDLRAPLRALDGFSRILLEDFAAQLPEDAVRHLNRVRGGAVQMGRLIDDLLRFSRLNRQPLDRQPMNMTLLVHDVWDSLESDRENRRVELTINALPDCLGDAPLLKQVWANLLGNSLKYTRTREEASVEVGCLASVHREGQSPLSNVYFVRDNGVGFDMQFADKLFRVFQRLHRQDEYEGTGVGLATVRRIVARHGGVVWAESVLDAGTTFYFTVPESPEDGMQSDGAESSAAIVNTGVPVS